MNIHRIAQEMRPVIYQAGHIAMQHFRQVAVEHKEDHSFVTAADREVEAFIHEEIHRRYPDHGFFGEESGHHRMDDAEYVWAIDPIDGTAPFVYELPVWGVSIGLIHKSRLMLGFLYLPVLDELYWALENGPAYLNNQPIHVSEPLNLSKKGAIVSSSKILKSYKIKYTKQVFAFGSAAANLCFVARGKVHGGLQERVRLYDIAGAAVILKAAGGVMRYLSGREVNLWELLDGRKATEPFVFGHPENVEQLLTLFSLDKN